MMDKHILIDFIAKMIPASDASLEAIAIHFEERVILNNDYFLREGTVSNDYLFLASGFMRAFTHNTDGDEVTTYFYNENRVVFEASSFFMRTASAENIQALTDCHGFSITFEKLNLLFHTIPEFREFGRAVLVSEFASFKQRTLAMINTTAETRYLNLITNNKAAFQYAPLKQIASYLGITDTSLSRIRRDFAKKH